MFFKLICLDRSYFLQRDPQFFEHYPDALAAAGEALRSVAQGSVIEVTKGTDVLLRMRCEKSAQEGMVPGALLGSATGPDAAPRH